MRDRIPRVGRMTLEPLTPLHIGAGDGVGKPLVDKCMKKPIPSEYQPSEYRRGKQQVVCIKPVGGVKQPYIPASTVRGMLRGMYECVAGNEAAKKFFGSTNLRGRMALSDLMAENIDPNRDLFKTKITCICPYRLQNGRCYRGSRQRSFPSQFIAPSTEERPLIFGGEILFAGESMLRVLDAIFDQLGKLATLLKADGKNPELALAQAGYKSYIGLKAKELFRHPETGLYVITWKLGKFSKAYSKALSDDRWLGSGKHQKDYDGLPYAFFYVPLDEGRHALPGWVRITIDLRQAEEFELNLMEA